MSFAIVLHHLRRRIFEGPHRTVAVGIQEVYRRRNVEWPLIDELAVFVEYLHPAITAIADVDTPRDRIGGDAVNDIEVVRTRLLTSGFATLTPCRHEFSILVELHDAIAVITIGGEHRTVR